jgi:hypothetical protein
VRERGQRRSGARGCAHAGGRVSRLGAAAGVRGRSLAPQSPQPNQHQIPLGHTCYIPFDVYKRARPNQARSASTV